MKMLSRSRQLAVTALLMTGLWSANAIAADGAFEQRIPLGEALQLDVTTGSGKIVIRAGAGNEAIVRGEIRVNRRAIFGKPKNWEDIVREIENDPPIVLNGERLEVGHFSDRRLGKKVSISYEITLPASSQVIANTGSGSISVSDIAASVEAHTGSGSIEVANISGPVTARTGSGSIDADGVGGEFRGSTGSGRIKMLQTAPGDVTVSTGSGSTELNGVVGAVRATTGSGGITVEGRMTNDWDLDTGSGSVRVALPEDAAFDLDAESRSGDIEIDYSLTVTGKISEKHLRGSVGGGGPELRIDTGSGEIQIQ
jgi:hypothetical protein